MLRGFPNFDLVDMRNLADICRCEVLPSLLMLPISLWCRANSGGEMVLIQLATAI